MSRLRDIYRFLAPAWLTEDEGGKVLSTIGWLLDAAHDRMRAALDARFPQRYLEDGALALTGEDRGIVRGRTETRAHYAKRLTRWRHPRGHKTRGNAFALLEQASEYFGGVDCYTVDRRGNVFSHTAMGEQREPSLTWDWDGAPVSPRWARGWLIIAPPVDVARAWPDWDVGGGFEWGDSAAAIGLYGVSPDDADAIRKLVDPTRNTRPWLMAGSRCEWIIFSLDGAPATEPGGTYGAWSYLDVDTQRPTRHAEWRFVSVHGYEYAGDPDSFASFSEGPAGVLFSGDPDLFPGSVAGYSGDPDSFPTPVQLPDDASSAG